MQLVQKFIFFNLFLLGLLFNLSACNVGSGSGFQQEIASRALSLSDPTFRTCVFDPGHSVVHFPIYHSPPQQGQVSNEDYEKVVKSQFQLLHTLLDYNRSYTRLAVFEESVTTDLYNENYMARVKRGDVSQDTITKLDRTQFFIANEAVRIRNLFQNGFPAFYEQMIPQQKRLLWDLGAVFVLYFLEEIPRIHKVITEQEFNYVTQQLHQDYSGVNIQQKSYWVFNYREERLRAEVQGFLTQNAGWQGLVFIVYGRDHDFSDDFAGYPFQSGHSFCLGWDRIRVASNP